MKRLLLDGKVAIGTWVFLGPDVVELAAVSGFDFVIIDSEHSSTDIGDIEYCLRAADAAGITALVRVGGVDRSAILRVLEAGAHGVVVPHIESGEQGRRAVSAVRYPPEGDRGSFGYTRAARYGSVPVRDHVTTSNREVLVVGMIETAVGVANANAIAASGFDGVFIGRSDLATALGVPGQGDHPAVVRAISTVSEALRAHHVWAIGGAGDPNDVKQGVKFGYRAFTFGHEYALLAHAYQAVLPDLRAAGQTVGVRRA